MNFGRKRYFLVRNLMGVILILIWLTSGGFSNAAYAISGQAGKQLAQTENKNFNKANQITPKEILGGQDEAGQIGMEINTLATSMFSDVYGGMELTNNGKDIIVYLTNLDSKVENYIKNQYPLSNIIFKKTNNNMDQMKINHKKVINYYSTLTANGIKIIKWGPDIQTGKEFIKVKDLTESQRSYLINKFGSENIEVQSITESEIPVPLATRSNDSAPWNGGDFITNKNSDCTSGFGAHSGSTDYMITAAHCFSVGDYVYNGASTLNLGNNNMYGKVTLKDISNGGVDAELINTSGYGGSSRLIFTGSSTNPYTAAVSGATTSLKSYQVCQSGAFEGEICGLVIQVSDECLTVGGRYICHVVEATNTSGGIAVGQGDSGGPVFRFNGSYLYATGISTAGSNTVPCSNYPSNRSCFSTLYYTNINSILSSLGVSLN